MLTMNNDCPDREIAKDNPSNNCAKLKLIPCPSLVVVALLLGVCRASLGQGDAILEAPGLAPVATTLASGNVTLFQNVRIFDCGSIAVRITANANTATAKANATTRTLRCSNFPEALAKKSTVANKTVFARY